MKPIIFVRISSMKYYKGTMNDTPENGGYGEANVIPYDNGITAVQALKNNQIDCVIIDSAPAQEFVKANPGLKILDMF